MTASLLFINMLEEALEKGEVLHTCSWDITRAFDSVSKTIMKMAWARLNTLLRSGKSIGEQGSSAALRQGRRSDDQTTGRSKDSSTTKDAPTMKWIRYRG